LHTHFHHYLQIQTITCAAKYSVANSASDFTKSSLSLRFILVYLAMYFRYSHMMSAITNKMNRAVITFHSPF